MVDDARPSAQSAIIGVDRSRIGNTAGGALGGLDTVNRNIPDETFGRTLPVGILAAVGEEEQVVREVAEVDASNDGVRPQHGQTLFLPC